MGALAGKSVDGWKCAFPSAGKWIVASIYSDCIVSGVRYRLPADINHARLEPELACMLIGDLPFSIEPYPTEQIMAAIGDVHLALEAIDCRYIHPQALPLEQLLADSLFTMAWYLGRVSRRRVSLTCPHS